MASPSTLKEHDDVIGDVQIQHQDDRLEHIMVDELENKVDVSFASVSSSSTTLDSQASLMPAVSFISSESAFTIAMQVILPFMIAGYGTVGAGLVLDVVQHWPVFKDVSEVMILVPALLGLKGNLEMTLASRLSTCANIGHFDTSQSMIEIIYGNLALTQVQAVVVGTLAAVVAVFLDAISPSGQFDAAHCLILTASSLLTASCASFILGLLMVFVIYISRKMSINPDNVATPIAASFGDLITLTLLAYISSFLYNHKDVDLSIAPVLIGILLLIAIICFIISFRNCHVKNVLLTGWTPIIAAMSISSLGGLILDKTVSGFDGFAIFNPVVNGVGGNLAAVHASRISTYLHLTSNAVNRFPEYMNHYSIPVISTFFSRRSPHSKTALVLLTLLIPGHIAFLLTIGYLPAGHLKITFGFSLMYLTCAFIQVVIVLTVADWLVHCIWRWGGDPDNIAIPYLTALGDLLGTGLLALGFQLIFVVF